MAVVPRSVRSHSIHDSDGGSARYYYAGATAAMLVASRLQQECGLFLSYSWSSRAATSIIIASRLVPSCRSSGVRSAILRSR
jgi:hypothetical protein